MKTDANGSYIRDSYDIALYRARMILRTLGEETPGDFGWSFVDAYASAGSRVLVDVSGYGQPARVRVAVIESVSDRGSSSNVTVRFVGDFQNAAPSFIQMVNIVGVPVDETPEDDSATPEEETMQTEDLAPVTPKDLARVAPETNVTNPVEYAETMRKLDGYASRINSRTGLQYRVNATLRADSAVYLFRLEIGAENLTDWITNPVDLANTLVLILNSIPGDDRGKTGEYWELVSLAARVNANPATPGNVYTVIPSGHDWEDGSARFYLQCQNANDPSGFRVTENLPSYYLASSLEGRENPNPAPTLHNCLLCEETRVSDPGDTCGDCAAFLAGLRQPSREQEFHALLEEVNALNAMAQSGNTGFRAYSVHSATLEDGAPGYYLAVNGKPATRNLPYEKMIVAIVTRQDARKTDNANRNPTR